MKNFIIALFMTTSVMASQAFADTSTADLTITCFDAETVAERLSGSPITFIVSGQS